ncbi:MAG: endonuclease/exonuclease/phosphatase family protein [Elusimicrobia bacterium]|nr:endonuclease/exonuclease/phosphatase family protein [Elusimicrobiota bacterium]
MSRWGALLAAVLALASPGRAADGLQDSFGALTEEVKETSAPLAERAADPKARRPVVRVISWNVQAFGANVSPEREAAYREVLGHMLSDSRSARILSFQEIANATGAAKIGAMLPGAGERWNDSFTNTNGAMDNGFFAERGVGMGCERPLFARQDERGRWQRDREKAMHTPRAAHMRVGNFDFTLLSIHLTFGGGDSRESARELTNILDWVARYLAQPGADPDVIITGDLNIPTNKGRSKPGPSVEDVVAAHPAFGRQGGSRRFVALVDAPTSRNREGQPVNNYDHVLMTGDAYDEEYAKSSAGVVPHDFMRAIEERHGTMVSDHLPVSAGFYTSGEGGDGKPIAADGDSACRVLLSMSPLK